MTKYEEEQRALDILLADIANKNDSRVTNYRLVVNSAAAYGNTAISLELRIDGLMSLITLGCEKMCSKNDKIVRNYEFVVKTFEMVDIIEISKYITRDNPLSIIFYKDLDFNITIIHRNIIEKAKAVALYDYFVDKSEKVYRDIFFYKTPKKDNEFIIKTVKMIKRAEWPKNYRSCKVRVIFPKI